MRRCQTRRTGEFRCFEHDRTSLSNRLLRETCFFRCLGFVFFFLEGFYFSHKLPPSAAGAAQREPRRNQSWRWPLPAPVLGPKTLPRFTVWLDRKLRDLCSSPRVSSAHEAANAVPFLPNKRGLQARSQHLARRAGWRAIRHAQRCLVTFMAFLKARCLT